MNRFRRHFALIIVCSWIAGLFLLLVLAAADTKPDRWLTAMKDFGSISSGLVGTIVGYYFGSETQRRDSKDDVA